MIIDIARLKEIAEVEFWEIVVDVIITDVNNIRIFLIDDSFIDIWFSLILKNRFSYHWERKHIDGVIYRHDNAPHKKWKNITTYPKHFHNGKEESVTESFDPQKAIREFLQFVKKKL